MITEKEVLGDCFEASLHYIMDHMDDKDVRLVHGIVYHPKTGWHFHAWIERNEWCIDVANGKYSELPTGVFYYFGKVDKVRTYKPFGAIKQALRHQNYGAWEPRLYSRLRRLKRDGVIP